MDIRRARRSRDEDTHSPILRLTDGKTLALRAVFATGPAAEAAAGPAAVDHINGWLG